MRTGDGIDSHHAVTRFFGIPSSKVQGDRLPDTGFNQYGGSLRAAWSVRRVPRRIGTDTDFRGFLLTDRVQPGVHVRDTWARLVAVLPDALTTARTAPSLGLTGHLPPRAFGSQLTNDLIDPLSLRIAQPHPSRPR